MSSKSFELIFFLLFFSVPAWAWGNLNYDYELLVFAYFVKNTGNNESSGLRRSLFNVQDGTHTSNVFSVKLAGKYISVPLQGSTSTTTTRLNSAQKPMRLIRMFVELFTLPGEKVLDLCTGTGTGAIACLLSNRDCLSIDSDDIQFNMFGKRISDAETWIIENTDDDGANAGRVTLGNVEL